MERWLLLIYLIASSLIMILVFKDVDEAAHLVAGHTDDEALSPQEGRRIRNKIDWIVLPLLFAVWTCKYCDIERYTLALLTERSVVQFIDK